MVWRCLKSVPSPPAGAPSWNDVCLELSTIRSKWYNFGLHLGVPYHKLKDFEKKEDPLSEVIAYWHKRNTRKPVTWGSVVATLRRTEESALADKIEAKYCKVKVISPQLLFLMSF